MFWSATASVLASLFHARVTPLTVYSGGTFLKASLMSMPFVLW